MRRTRVGAGRPGRDPAGGAAVPPAAGDVPGGGRTVTRVHTHLSERRGIVVPPLDVVGLRGDGLDAAGHPDRARYDAAWGAAERALRGYLRRLLRDAGVREHEVDDAAQEVWITAHQHIRRVTCAEEFVAWLAGAARFRARTLARAGARASAREAPGNVDLDAFADTAPDALEEIIDPEPVQFLRAEVARLDTPDRELCRAVYSDGRVVADVAHDLRVSRTTVYNRLERITARLRAALDGLLGPGDGFGPR